MQSARQEPRESSSGVAIEDIEISNLGAIPSGLLTSLNAGLNALGGLVIVFLQVPNSVGAGRFIRSDEFHKLITRRTPRVGNLLATLYELAGAGLIAVLCAGTVPVFLDSWQNGRYMGNPGVFTAPMWPVQLTIIVGSGLTALVFLYAAVLHLKNIDKRPA